MVPPTMALVYLTTVTMTSSFREHCDDIHDNCWIGVELYKNTVALDYHNSDSGIFGIDLFNYLYYYFIILNHLRIFAGALLRV